MNTPNTVYMGPFFAFDWRDFHFFGQMDEAQVDAGIELTLDICRRHEIEPSFYYPSTTFDFPRCFQVATIVCHFAAGTRRISACRIGCTRRWRRRGFGWFVREGEYLCTR